MNEFAFLRAMFRRLDEFEQWRAKAANEGERQAHDGAAIAIKASINDYLALRCEHARQEVPRG